MEKTTISLGLPIYKVAWFVINDSAFPEVEKALHLGMFITNKEDAEKAVENGHQVIELDWCRFQTMIQNMQGRY